MVRNDYFGGDGDQTNQGKRIECIDTESLLSRSTQMPYRKHHIYQLFSEGIAEVSLQMLTTSLVLLTTTRSLRV